MQQLAGPDRVRYLDENAGSMHVHHSVLFVVSPAEVRCGAGHSRGPDLRPCLSLHFDTWSNDGGVFTQRFLTLDFLLQQLGLSTWCAQTDLTCECFHKDAVCACSESAEEESDDAFESNHPALATGCCLVGQSCSVGWAVL